MSIIKFTDLVFDKTGCCGAHPWAEIMHTNGKISSVYNNSDGSFSVVTQCVGILMRPMERYNNEQEVETRLNEDAA